MVSSVILDPHKIIKQAGMMEHATANAAGLRPIRVFGYMYRGVNNVFTAEVYGQNGRTRASTWPLISS